MDYNATIIKMIKSSAWEEAKGKLRAVAAIHGSYYGPDMELLEKWTEFETRIEDFIKGVEEDGLHE